MEIPNDHFTLPFLDLFAKTSGKNGFGQTSVVNECLFGKIKSEMKRLFSNIHLLYVDRWTYWFILVCKQICMCGLGNEILHQITFLIFGCSGFSWLIAKINTRNVYQVYELKIYNKVIVYPAGTESSQHLSPI